MKTEDLKRELSRWAEFQSMRYARAENDEDGPGSHPLSKAREFAPMTRQAAAKLLAGRDGRSRREYMGAAAGLAISPQWATDPIPCTETRYLGPAVASFDRGIPPGYEWIEHGLTKLSRTNPTQALCVRKEFTVQASQRIKANMVAEETGRPLSKSQYRRELTLGMSFLAGRRGGD